MKQHHTITETEPSILTPTPGIQIIIGSPNTLGYTFDSGQEELTELMLQQDIQGDSLVIDPDADHNVAHLKQIHRDRKSTIYYFNPKNIVHILPTMSYNTLLSK